MVDINLIPKEYKGRGLDFANIFSKTGGIALILFILSLLIYGGLFFYSQALDKKLESVKQEITTLDSKRDSTTESAIDTADKKLELIEGLFKDHFYWSKLFSEIEKAVVPQVYFSESKFNFAEEKVNLLLSGSAKGYTAVAQQMVSFKENSSVEEIEVSNIRLNDSGGVEFDLAIVFSKSILLSAE